MLILTIRSDKPEAEIALFDDGEQVAVETWLAHRQLAETIHQKILNLLKSKDKSWADLAGIAVYEGPGSFTGLRIGFSVANTLGYGLDVPIATAGGEGWIAQAVDSLKTAPRKRSVAPEYGQPVATTVQKK